jgi:hypothetical protein
MHESDSCKTRDLGLDGNVILKMSIKKQVAKMWIGLFCFRTGFGGKPS